MAEEPISHNELEKEIKSPLQMVSDDNDMYDHQWVELNEALVPIQRKYMGKANTRKNLEEFEKEAVDAALKCGIIIRVHISEVLMGISSSPVIEPTGRISFEHGGEFDHQYKRAEVLDSKAKNEPERGMVERKKKRA